MKILILGGGGYVGSALVDYLLKKNYSVIVIDNFWFGNFLKKNKKLTIVKKDIRDINQEYFKKVNAVIHLANIANDPMVDLKPELSWEVNVLSIKRIMELSIKNKISKFIYASSGSVYGVKKEKEVTEDLELVPISTYNKTKMISERVILSYSKLINTYIVRPATVCGYSPRMRLDLSVNNLTFQALKDKKINIHGGDQVRPNIHIKDMCRVYFHFLNKNIKPGIYNAGFENLSIRSIALKIKNKIDCKLIFKKIIDIRSYRQNSDKLSNTGFFPKYNVDIAIEEIIDLFKKNILKNRKQWYSVNWLKTKIF
jgi:nucleoside-diphosphate-sugar epimerase